MTEAGFDFDTRVRLAAFDFLNRVTNFGADNILERAMLLKGITVGDERIPLIAPQQGIHKPRQLELPLSLFTSTNHPYEDTELEDGRIVYSYRGSNPDHPDNVGVRRAMECNTPLIYVRSLEPNRYAVCWPMYVTEDRRARLQFVISDEGGRIASAVVGEEPPEKRYAMVPARLRLHQAVFRYRVIRADILRETDGPMLRHGLQEMHGQLLQFVPTDKKLRPDPARLEERFALFKSA